MDMSIDAYKRLLDEYKTDQQTASKVNQIFSQGKSGFSDPEYEAIVAGFMQNQAINGLFERVQIDKLGLRVMPTDQKSLGIALLTKKGYDIVATDKDLAGEVMDIIARKPESGEVIVMKCGPAIVRKLIGYLQRPNTNVWILDGQYRLFMFSRGPQWDAFMELHKNIREGGGEPAESTEKPPAEEPQTPADVIRQAERAQSEPAAQQQTEAKAGATQSAPEKNPEMQPENAAEEAPGEENAFDGQAEEPESAGDEAEKEKSPVFVVGNRKLPRVLTEKEVARMISISKPIQRDSLILQCLYFLGMSNAEVQNLRVEDIDFVNGKVRISQGKNRRDRMLPIPAELQQDLKAFIGARSEGFLIRGRDKKGKRISDRHIRRIVKSYAKEAGVKNYDEIHPHTLRHSYAVHLLDAGTPIESVQNILGHERLETTAIYSALRNTRQLQEHVNGALGHL